VARADHGAGLAGDANGEGAQFVVEGNRLALLRLAVEQRAFRHRLAEHLLQAEGLRAELHFVGAMRLRTAALVFDRVGRIAMEFDGIRLAVKAMDEGAQREPAQDADARAAVWPAAVDPLVHQPPLGGGAVLRPELLHMDQRALPRAEQVVLQGRHRHQRVLRGRVGRRRECHDMGRNGGHRL